MGTTNFTGLTINGVPVQAGGGSLPMTTGDVYFVDSGTGVTGNNGTSKASAIPTIDEAHNKCTASQGDIIVVMEGHAENIASATSLVLDTAGVTIIGLGRGRNRPTLTFTATASRIPISADDVYMSNFLLDASIASIVSGVTITGDDVTLDNIEWNFDATGIEFLQMLDIDACSRAVIQNCQFVAENIAGTNTGIRFDTAAYMVLRNNIFRGDFTTAAISGTTGSAAASTDVLIDGNLIENKDTTAGLLLDVHDTGTGIVANNRGFTLFATAPETAFDTGNALACENYVVNAVDESGLIIPELLST